MNVPVDIRPHTWLFGQLPHLLIKPTCSRVRLGYELLLDPSQDFLLSLLQRPHVAIGSASDDLRYLVHEEVCVDEGDLVVDPVVASFVEVLYQFIEFLVLLFAAVLNELHQIAFFE